MTAREDRLRCAAGCRFFRHTGDDRHGTIVPSSEPREPVIITQHGEATVVLQDVASWEATQQTLALLKILTLRQREVEAGEVIPIAQAVERIRAHDP